MDTNGISVGDFVEIYPRSDSSWDYDHVGIVFDFEDRDNEGISARIMWLTEDCCNAVHWNVFMLRKTLQPKVIDWNKLTYRMTLWFNQVYRYVS